LSRNSSDSLEEVIGLDVGYTGGVLQKRAQAQNDDMEGKMDNYIEEYVKQRGERAAIRRLIDDSTHGRSILGVSLHSVGNILDSSLRDGKTSSLARANSAIDWMERSRSSNGNGDVENLSKSEHVASLTEASSLRRVEDQNQHTSFSEIQEEAWQDNENGPIAQES
jgi:hypothetical protein